MISTLCALKAVVHVKNTNLLASEDITVATARLSSSKQLIGMRILIRFTVQRSGVSLPANPQVLWGFREGRITSDGIKQSIRFTDVYRVMIPPLSGGLELGITRLSSLKVDFHLRVFRYARKRKLTLPLFHIRAFARKNCATVEINPIKVSHSLKTIYNVLLI